jgi:photosystem II stability/assembly factor-like uncharacterized protein
MRFRPAALWLLTLTARAVLALPGWETSGPKGVRANAVSAAGDDDARAYAAATILDSSTSAIDRTDDAGQTWNALIEAPRGDSYTQVFADPRDGFRVFAAAQKGTATTDILRSIDRGDNWSTVLTVSTRCVPSFATGAGADSLLFTCGTRFFRTSDVGLTWEEPTTPFTENVRLTAGGGGVLLAYGVSHIFRSVTGGTSWVETGGPPAACAGLLSLRVDPATPSVLLAGTGVVAAGGFACGGVYRSTNGGSTWSAPSLSGVYVTDLVFDPTDATRVYACATSIAGILPPGGVYVSGDGGRTFSSLALPTTGALDLAISATGNLIHAATPIGVFEYRVRRTRVVPAR